jgi:hypothetical protein
LAKCHEICSSVDPKIEGIVNLKDIVDPLIYYKRNLIQLVESSEIMKMESA